MDYSEKAHFLKEEFTKRLAAIPEDAPRKWGKMNVQQMIEHMSDSVRIANGKDPHKVVSAPENIERMRGFMMSEKPFKENTVNVLLREEPEELRHINTHHALKELQREIDDFFKTFEGEEEKTITNPFFGELNMREWVQLLHKHAMHHLNQFGAGEQEKA